MPYRTFDLVISTKTVHNLELGRTIDEMKRVGRGFKYLRVNFYRNDEEHEKSECWGSSPRSRISIPTAGGFRQAGYAGEHSWTIRRSHEDRRRLSQSLRDPPVGAL
jgi:hypothetical protein